MKQNVAGIALTRPTILCILNTFYNILILKYILIKRKECMGAYETTSLNGERLLRGAPIGRTVLNRK